MLPVQLKSQCPIDGSETQQSDPSQQDAAKNTGLEVQDPNLHKQQRLLDKDFLETHLQSSCNKYISKV